MVTSPGARSTSSDSTATSFSHLETTYSTFNQSSGIVRSFELQDPLVSHLQDPRRSWNAGPARQTPSSHSMRPQSRKLASQYPPDASESHVEFILVAAFDTDRGSVMEHQYPGPISGDEHMLAELMLPDQAHSRSQDWTIFFLHKDSGDTAQLEEDAPKVRRRNKIRSLRRLNNDQGYATVIDEGDEYSTGGFSSNEDADEEDNSMEGPPLIYVLNLVNTKKDSTAKRGATVKAMAVCTRHPFLHIYKPLLLLALEDYFRAPVTETLAALYEAVNSMDLSLMPRLSPLERNILQASNAKNLFLEKFQRMIDQKRAEGGPTSYESTPRSSTDTSGPLKYLLPRDTHEFESRVIYNGISVPVKIPTARSPETVGDFSIIKLIQTFSDPHMTAPQPFALHPHLTTSGAYTHPIIVLVNAILTQKRIMFLGYNRPSGDVAEAVLASCALASGGILRGFTRHAFPYTDLTKIDDLLKVPGFIAGVTNPVFANKPECWDLLCDLPAGRMKISSRIAQPVMTDGIATFQQQNPTVMSASWNPQVQLSQDFTGDVAFMEAVQRNISNHLGEVVVRMMWRDWVVRFTRIAAAFEEAIYGTSALFIGGPEADAGAHGVTGHGYVWSDEATRQRELAGNVQRIEGWRNTRSYYSLIQDLAQLYTSKPITSIDLHHHHDRLRTQKLRQDEAAAIYLAFAATIQSPAEICQALTVTSESHGGLFCIALGLLHPRRDVRYKIVELLDRIMHHEAGRPFWESLNRFSRLAFYRLKGEMDSSTARSPNDSDAERGPLMEEVSIEAAFRAAQRDGGSRTAPHHDRFGVASPRDGAPFG